MHWLAISKSGTNLSKSPEFHPNYIKYQLGTLDPNMI